MPVTSVTKDPAAATMTVVAQFDAPVRRSWDSYRDPRLIERFWGPPTYPAVFTRHDGCVGGRSEYAMTGPEGDVSRGHWEWVEVEPTSRFVVRDGFSNPDGTDNSEMPSMRMVFGLEPTETGSKVTVTTYFDSAEELERLIEMGMEEGMSQAMGQMDEVIADVATFAVGRGTVTQILDDTHVRISRVVAGDVDSVWRAHHEPEIVQQWMLGPDGWTMPVCEVATEVGEEYRYEWEQEDGSARFGFTGRLVESMPPHRAVTTEAMVDMDGPSTLNELTLTELADGVLVSCVIVYPDAELRDTILATGMADGMEASYARLEALIG